jgi:hypothetical protein
MVEAVEKQAVTKDLIGDWVFVAAGAQAFGSLCFGFAVSGCIVVEFAKEMVVVVVLAGSSGGGPWT